MVSARNIFALVVMTQMSLVFAHSHVYRNITSADGNFMLEWKHNASASKLMFKITCKGSSGWCGVGFTETADGRTMKDYDIAVGGLAGMQGYIRDYWSTSTTTPSLDSQQDFMLTSASDADSKTVVEFTRNVTTGDDKDVQFMVNKTVWVVWAFNTGTDAENSISKHSAGTTGVSIMEYSLIPDTPPTNPPTTDVPTTYVRSINSTDGTFMLQWTHNVNASKLMFKITCQGTGWCGVGFTETDDGRNMVNYDIAVGGYASNAGYMKDYWSTSTTPPSLDSQQDFILTSASQEGGKTVVEFTRDATTGDDEDVPFTVDKPVWVVWASNTGTDADSSISKHSAGTTGVSTMKYSLIKADTPTTGDPTKASTTEKASASIVGPSFVFCMLLVFKALFYSE